MKQKDRFLLLYDFIFSGLAIIATVLMIVGIGLIGSLTSTITALFFQKHEQKAPTSRDRLIKSIQEQLDNFDDLSDDDLKTICDTLNFLHEENSRNN